MVRMRTATACRDRTVKGQNVECVPTRLNGQVVRSCSAAGAAGLAESPLVFLIVSAAGAKQKPVGASILDL